MQRGQVPRGSPEIHFGDATAIKGCQRDKDETLYPLHGPHDELSDEQVRCRAAECTRSLQ